MSEPSEFMNDYGTRASGDGLFFDDYCNWQRIPEFEQVVRESRAAEVAAALMQSERAQFFHDHILVKEPGASRITPWHSDSPYYFVSGSQTVSFWVPLDPVENGSLRLVRGSHRWTTEVQPTSWVDGAPFYSADVGDHYQRDIDPDADPALDVIEWPMQPGDAVAFSFRMTHGARANKGPQRRRAFSMRWVGDDVRFVDRGERTSPPFPGHGMRTGDQLRTDWFPVIHQSEPR